MEENKFEKQVQEKMDELKIQPAETVWEKIEMQLGNKKRINRRLIFLFLLFIMLFTGSYLLWNLGYKSVSKNTVTGNTSSGKHTNEILNEENKIKSGERKLLNSINDSVETEAKNVAGDKGQNKILIKKNNSAKATTQHFPFAVKSNENKIDKNVAENNKNKNPPVNKKSFTITQLSALRIKVAPADIKEKKLQEETLAMDYFSEDRLDTKMELQEIHTSAYKKIGDTVNNLLYQRLNIDSDLNQGLSKEKATEKDSPKPVNSPAKNVQQQNKNKWKPGIFVSGGFSSAGNNTSQKSNAAAVSLDPNLNNNIGQRYNYYSPVIKSAFGFIIGISVEKNILPKTKFVTGINFKTFNTINIVSLRNDTISAYSLQLPAKKINNHYNFIELPVSIKVQTGKEKKLPVVWQGGFVISQLISSNALQYNESINSYYTNNSLFNKTQIGFNTSVSLELFSTQKNSILIGPYFYYGLSKIGTEGLYNNKHFLFSGLHTEIIFGK